MKRSAIPAFPITEEATDRILTGIQIFTGLSKREYFAAAALQGLLANKHNLPNQQGYEYCVMVAIKSADEMLKQLEQ